MPNFWEGDWEDPDSTKLIHREYPAKPTPPNVRPISSFPMDENAVRRVARDEAKRRNVYSEQIGFWSSFIILIKGLTVLAILAGVLLFLRTLYYLPVFSAM